MNGCAGRDPGANGQDARFRGARGGRPPNLAGGVPLRLARATNRAERAVFSGRRQMPVSGRGAVGFAPRPTILRLAAWRSGSDRVGFAHQPGFFSPARRRRPHPRRGAGRGRQAEGARNHGRYGFSAPVAVCRECRAARPRRAARQSAHRAKAPSSGSDAGTHSRRVKPLGRFVEFQRRSGRPHQRKLWGGARRTVGLEPGAGVSRRVVGLGCRCG